MNQTHSSTFAALLMLATALLFAPAGSAAISVKLQQPKWTFLLQNQLPKQTEAQLSPNERNFARRIQPLLASQDHQAIINAFAERDMKDDSAALRLLRGQIWLSLKQYDKAEQALTAALQQLPNLALAHRSLSLVYLLQQKFALAQTHLQRTITSGVADAEVYGQLGYIHLQLHQPASAIASYQYALMLEANNDQWRQGLLYALIKSQALDQAQALLEEMIQAAPKEPALWLQRGQIALQQQRYEQALASLEMAMTLGDNSPENLATAAQLHIQSGSPSRAVALLADNLSILITSDTSSKIEVVEQIVDWLTAQQQWSKLSPLLTAIAASKVQIPAPFKSSFAVARAKLALHNGQAKKAQKQLERAIKHNPTNGEALLSLATLLYDNGQVERALLYYVRAGALPTYQTRALIGHAQLEIDRQNYPEALRILRQVSQTDPSRSDILANIQSLQHLVRNRS